MNQLHIIRRFYCTPIGNYFFIYPKKDTIHFPKIKKIKKHSSTKNNTKGKESEYSSYKGLYNFKPNNCSK